MEKSLDAQIAEDLLSRINPSIQADRLSNAMQTCSMGRKQAEQTIIKGLELLAKEKKEENDA